MNRAALFTVPFTQRFDRLDAGDRRVYYAAVIAAAAATLLLIAPTAHHRLRFRSGIKEQLLQVTNVFALVGLVLLAIAVAAVTYLITDLLYGATAAAVAAGALGGGFVIAWLVVPLLYRPEPTPPASSSRPDR